MNKSNQKNQANACNVNFGKVSEKSVKVFLGKKQHTGVEIIGEKGQYSVYTDPKLKELSRLRGTSGSLQDVKKKVSDFLCGEKTPNSTKKADKVA